jgi:uncharacterized lipoprotein YbaY
MTPVLEKFRPVGNDGLMVRVRGALPPAAVAAVKLVDLPSVMIVGDAGVTVI